MCNTYSADTTEISINRKAKKMKKIAVVSASAAILALFAFVAISQAELYQYTDKNGVLVITDKKPNSRSRVSTFRDSVRKADTLPEQDSKTEGRAKKPEKNPEQIAAEQAEKQAAAAEAQKRRNQEADRLEAEARKPTQFSKEKQMEQIEKLNRAGKLRRGVDDPS